MQISAAIQDFHRARRKADMEEILSRLRGRSADLLSYEEVRKQLKAVSQQARGLQEIPLDAIVGSAGRYADFTRSFLPRQDSSERRWANVKLAMTDLQGVPPIEVYRIGDVYFVHDGHHRVSVARQLGSKTIEAYVTDVPTKVPISPDVQPGELILKAEYADFLERTQIDLIRPGADFTLTVQGGYRKLLEHIDVHRHFMGLEQRREIAYEEAVAHWYDVVYRPVVESIRARGVLRDFPHRSEADLYLWVSEHQAELSEAMSWRIDVDQAATDLAERAGSRPTRVISRVKDKVLDVVTPDSLEVGPSPGTWRREEVERRRKDCLFPNVLATVRGDEEGWSALESAIEVARREGGRVRGLHLVQSEAELHGEEIDALGNTFQRLCDAAGVPGDFAVDLGGVARRVAERAVWSDLVVLHLKHPPPSQPLGRLGSGFRMLIRLSSRPVLAVPTGARAPARALLAYDGSPRSREALFVATYLAARWGLSLAVVTVAEGERVERKTLAEALAYLENHGVRAEAVFTDGPVSLRILEVAHTQQRDLLIMGGYGARPLVEVVLGSNVDPILRGFHHPVLICS